MKTHDPGGASQKVSRRTLFKASAVTAAAAAVTIGGATTKASADVRGLTEVGNWRVSNRFWDFRFATDAMTLFQPSVRVILPDGYDQNPGRRYPVLLLLHGGHPEGGMNGNFLDWTEHGGTAHIDSAGKDVIIVCPDGGNGGFYVNWKAPTAAKVNWEEFHIPQLMNWVDQRLRTIAGLKTKAVAGLSMGGYGALTYAGRNPALFTSASSYSGPADTFHPGVVTVMTASPVVDGQLPNSIFAGDQAMMHQWNPRDLVEAFRGMRVYFSSGDGGSSSPVLWVQEATSRQTHIDFDNDLRARGIAHEYRYTPGWWHDWPNWRDNFARDLPGILSSLPHQ